MTAKKRLGVAIHGCGDVARAHAASWLKIPDVEIVSISSRNVESARKLADHFGLDCDVHDDFDRIPADARVDIVNPSGPNHVHTPQGVACADAGKHILVEKPMCITMEENRSLRDAVTRNGVKSLCSFVLRWNPLLEMLRSLMEQRAVGDPFYYEIDYWHGLDDWWSGWSWGKTRASGASAMLTGGCHALDALRFLTGEEVVEVSAYANNARGKFEYEANVIAALRFESGAIGKCSVLFDACMPYSFNIDLCGTEGSIRNNKLWSKRLFPGQTGWTEVGANGDLAALALQGRYLQWRVELVSAGQILTPSLRTLQLGFCD